ncbi:sugar phosphate isomerase/epimerase family protein [Variovorax fucosicus]|uniref:sugar phosphate isomerase/epimerase family protein n=1 Tax=Variovorax fucosicus TaxID=3053517 RepID=UPI002575B7B6|nr:glutamine ABC transporter ATP-binding protein [Variovorax sp. J22G47]MDM0058111.1 glutamine ABC transporter ATP-binding protein [Variovorax sp. J22G47]
MMSDVLISLSSFGAAEVGRHGQLFFAQLARAAGADSVEVRGELLRDPASELPALAGLASVYSSPEGLWAEGGWLDSAALNRGIAAATTLGARRLKMSLGDFRASSHGSLWGLKVQLAETRVELVIENDQTAAAGSVPALQNFFDVADRAGVELSMTFDMGNWHWLGECPLQAAKAFGSRVRYVHAKGVQRLPAKWVAVPLADSLAPWRSILRALPAEVPCAIEYPLTGDDLLAVTSNEVAQLRALRAA